MPNINAISEVVPTDFMITNQIVFSRIILFSHYLLFINTIQSELSNSNTQIQ